MSLVEKTKASIYGLQVLIAEDYSSKQEIEQKIKAKLLIYNYSMMIMRQENQ